MIIENCFSNVKNEIFFFRFFINEKSFSENSLMNTTNIICNPNFEVMFLSFTIFTYGKHRNTHPPRDVLKKYAQSDLFKISLHLQGPDFEVRWRCTQARYASDSSKCMLSWERTIAGAPKKTCSSLTAIISLLP